MTSHAQAFANGLDVTVDPALEARLDAWLAAARTAQPEVEVDAPSFLVFVAERIAGPDELDSLSPGDLCLAWAVALGQPAAVRVFREAYAGRMERLAARLAPPELAEEAVQRALARLLAESGIAKYAGRGTLQAFVESVAVREARMLHRGESRRRQREEMGRLADSAIVTRDPEIALLKRTYREAFQQAFAVAFAELAPRERNVLRYSFIDGLGIDTIGTIHGVGRSTAARWRADARRRLFDKTRDVIRREHQLSDSAYESVLRLVRSQLDVELPDD